MPLVRRRGIDISIFTLDGTSLLCELEEAEITVEADTEDASGACDEWKYAWANKRSWTLSYKGFVPASARGILDAASNSNVTVVFNTGANTYNGVGLMKTASHSVSKSSLQRESISIEGQGELTITAPS
jgi:hypothetical protein